MFEVGGFVAETPMPAYFLFHLQDVFSKMPILRHPSPTGTPDSACLRAKAIWSFVYLDLFAGCSPSSRAESIPKN